MSFENKLEQLKEYKEKFPSEYEKKQEILNNLSGILEACGCYLNDKELSLIYDGSSLTLNTAYGQKKLETEELSAFEFFEAVLNLLLENIKEFQFIKIK